MVAVLDCDTAQQLLVIIDPPIGTVRLPSLLFATVTVARSVVIVVVVPVCCVLFVRLMVTWVSVVTMVLLGGPSYRASRLKDRKYLSLVR